VLEDPLLELHKLLNKGAKKFEKENRIKQTIFLPLYGNNHKVFENSGLNQWHAKGRDRHPNEVYIPIPAEIHKNFPIQVETNYVGFEQQNDEKIEKPVVVILYFPSTSSFFCPFVLVHNNFVRAYNCAVQVMTLLWFELLEPLHQAKVDIFQVLHMF